MVAATLKLGIAILNGGNSTVQQVRYSFLSTHSSQYRYLYYGRYYCSNTLHSVTICHTQFILLLLFRIKQYTKVPCLVGISYLFTKLREICFALQV